MTWSTITSITRHKTNRICYPANENTFSERLYIQGLSAQRSDHIFPARPVNVETDNLPPRDITTLSICGILQAPALQVVTSATGSQGPLAAVTGTVVSKHPISDKLFHGVLLAGGAMVIQ